MKIITWNVRGLSSAPKRALMKGLITSCNPDFVILTETKLEIVNRFIIKSLWSSISIAWAFCKANGSSGGIIIMWDSVVHEAVEAVEGFFSLSINLKCSDGFIWWLTGIYGPASRRRRGDFWMELNTLKTICGNNWLLGGDFNVYRWANETTSQNPSNSSMRKFNAFIDNASLMEHSQSNGLYTWTNLCSQPTMSKIDRFLYADSWEQKFNCHYVKRLNRSTSDHYPLLLDSGSMQ